MSREQVELYRRAHEALKRGDLDAHLALCDREVVIEPHTSSVAGASYRGHDGVRQWWDDLRTAFPDLSMEIVEARDLHDENLILAALRVRGRGAGGGAPMDQTLWQVVRLRHNTAVWWGTYPSQHEALDVARRRSAPSQPASHKSGPG